MKCRHEKSAMYAVKSREFMGAPPPIHPLSKGVITSINSRELRDDLRILNGEGRNKWVYNLAWSATFKLIYT